MENREKIREIFVPFDDFSGLRALHRNLPSDTEVV